jgi:hypothetical protein
MLKYKVKNGKTKTFKKYKKRVPTYRNKFKTSGRTRHKTYSYKIRTAIVNYITPDYTEKNLKFDLYDLLRETDIYKSLARQYLQYKLDKVTFAATPRSINGTDPAPIWIYFDTSGNNVFNYSAMPELQGSKLLPVKHFSLTSYSSSGRQNDFHYWYDEQTEASDMAIRLHSEDTPTSSRYWQFQLEFSVKFRALTVPPSNDKFTEVKNIIRSGDQKVVEQGANQEIIDDHEEEENLIKILKNLKK